MGCYDVIVGNFVCPYCNTVERIVLIKSKQGNVFLEIMGWGNRFQIQITMV